MLGGVELRSVSVSMPIRKANSGDSGGGGGGNGNGGDDGKRRQVETADPEKVETVGPDKVALEEEEAEKPQNRSGELSATLPLNSEEGDSRASDSMKESESTTGGGGGGGGTGRTAKAAAVEKEEEEEDNSEIAVVGRDSLTATNLGISAGPSTQSCGSLAMTLRDQAPASGGFVSMDELWMAFVGTLEKREPSKKLLKSLRAISRPETALSRKASAQIMDEYQEWTIRSSGMAIDQHSLTTDELARRYDVCFATGISVRSAERIVKNLDERHEARPNQHRVWGNLDRLQQEAPWIGPGALELMAKNVRVLRSGKLMPDSASNVVPGDIVFLCGGNEVPADIRVLVCSDDAEVDTSQISYRHSQTRKITMDAAANQGDPLEASNLLAFGTVITHGELFGLVYRLGRETMLRSLSTAVVDTAGFTYAQSIPRTVADKAMKDLYELGLLLKSSMNLHVIAAVDSLVLCLPGIILGMRQTQESIEDLLGAGLRVVVILEKVAENDEIRKRLKALRPNAATFDLRDMERRLMDSSSTRLKRALLNVDGHDSPQSSHRTLSETGFLDLASPHAIERVTRQAQRDGLSLCWERLDRIGASDRLCSLVKRLKDDQDDEMLVMGVFSGRAAHIEAIKEASIGVVCRAFGQTTDGALRECDGVTWRRKEDNDLRWILPVVELCKELQQRGGHNLSTCCSIL